MKIAIRKNEIYRDYAKRFTDSQIQSAPYNYKLVEVGNVPEDCAYSDFDIVDNIYVFNQSKYNKRKNIPIIQEELNTLIEWFNWYDRQMQEYARCQRLGLDYYNTDGLSIGQLDELAEKNKARINELRNKIKEGGLLNG